MECLIEPNTALIFTVHLGVRSPNERIIRATTINDLIRVVTCDDTLIWEQRFGILLKYKSYSRVGAGVHG